MNLKLYLNSFFVGCHLNPWRQDHWYLIAQPDDLSLFQMEELEHAANPRDEHCLNRVWKYVVIFTLPIHVDFYRPFWFEVWFSKKILISSLLEGLLTKTKTRVFRWIKPHNAAHQYSLCDLQLWLREDQRLGQWTEEVKIN